ncbi:MAG: signal peptidase I [Thermodesulfobacteriota bacterium]
MDYSVIHSSVAPIRKEPWLAVILSLLLPGLGQIYTGRAARGWIIISSQIAIFGLSGLFLLAPWRNPKLAVSMLLIFPPLVIWNLFDAHRCGRDANGASAESARKEDKDPWLTVFLSIFISGLGHFYLRRWKYGILFLIGAFALWILEEMYSYPGTFLALLYYAFVLYHAYIASPVRREATRKPILKLCFTVFSLLALLGFSGLITKNHLAVPYNIPSRSMSPTFLVGDYMFALPDPAEINRGDVVVFTLPEGKDENEGGENFYIKRVVALAGDRIDIAERNLVINGKKIPLRPLSDFHIPVLGEGYEYFEESLAGNTHKVIYSKLKLITNRGKFIPAEVPPGHVFVMGDNRDYSKDSRFWGFVPVENIVGKPYLIYWSWDTRRRLPEIRWDRIATLVQ